MKNPKYIDTHAHFYLKDNPFTYSISSIVEECIKMYVTDVWLASTDFKDINRNLSYQAKYPDIVKSWVGIHPENAEEYESEKIRKIVKNNKNNIIGIGEIGIDLDDRLISASNKSNKDVFDTQVEVFDNQIKIALEYKLPVAIHSRNAIEETIEVLERYPDLVFVWHCYNLKLEKTKELINKFSNIYFGFNNIITYNSGKYINESLKIIPIEKLLLETDAPFLAPRPFAHKYNTPAGVINVYQHIAEELHLQTSELCEIILENTKQFTK